MGLFSDPPDDEPDNTPIEYPMPSELWEEINNEPGLVEEHWDYGYGGESYRSYRVDPSAVEQFILDRERRLLGGITLEEFLK